jgi:myo-inositol-1-phosphate synthase
MKSPHNQRPDDLAREATEAFIAQYARAKTPSPTGAKKKAPAAAE